MHRTSCVRYSLIKLHQVKLTCALSPGPPNSETCPIYGLIKLNYLITCPNHGLIKLNYLIDGAFTDGQGALEHAPPLHIRL
jgi:hypothetical protein